MKALERLKLVKRLLELRNEADGLGKGGAAAMRKLKIVREMIDIRNRLGLGGNAATPEPQATGTLQSIAAGMPGVVSAERPMDVPDGWVVMNAPRPLVGTQTMADGPMVAGRFWAAIDPNDTAAASYAEENRKNGAVVVVQASKSEQVEMALVGNEYADTYRKDYQGEELYKVLNPTSTLQGRTAGDLQGLLGQAKAAAEQAGRLIPTPGREGYDTPVRLDARLLKLALERTLGAPLAEKPEKLEAWRNGTARTNTDAAPIEIVFNSMGRLDVNDGRHRIALAAERGETVTAFIDGKDVQRVQKLLADLASEQEQPEEQNPHVKALQDLAAGKNDSQGLEWMFNIIQGAIDGLEEVNQLMGDNEAAANAAITHWAEFEERLNG